MEGKVTVRELAEMDVAYVRHVGPYAGNAELFEDLWGRLMRWAGPRKLLGRPDTQSLIVYHDNPEITDEDKLRVSVCVTVPADTEVDGEIGKMVVPGGEYAFARFELTTEQYGAAWQWVYGTWLPSSGYQPDDRPCFEMYPDGDEAKEGTPMIVDIVVPVKPL